MDQNKIKKIVAGVEKYLKIMKRYRECNVEFDVDFHKLYNGFYRIRQRSSKWYEHYYQMLESLKHNNYTFEELFKMFIERTGRYEASFISKMYATKNPNYPIIDKWVLKKIGLKLPYGYDRDRAEKTITLYDELIDWYRRYLASDEGKQQIIFFDDVCSGTDISAIKKVDFIFWQTR